MPRRLLRIAFVTLALGLCVYGVVSRRAEVSAALDRLSWYWLVGAVIAATLAPVALMLAWRALLADLGSPLPVRAAAWVMFVGQLGKYVPGGVWAPAAQVELSRSYGVGRARSATATVLAMIVTLTVTVAVAAATLPLTSAHAAARYGWVLALAPLLLLALHPRVIRAVLDSLLRLARRPPLEGSVGLGGMARAAGWSLLSVGLSGVHCWLLVAATGGAGGALGSGGGVDPVGATGLALATGAYALAWTVGFLVVIAPGGVGAREAALVAALAPVLTPGSALVVAIASRVVTVVGDLACAGAGFALRPAPGGPAPVTPSHPPGTRLP